MKLSAISIKILLCCLNRLGEKKYKKTIDFAVSFGRSTDVEEQFLTPKWGSLWTVSKFVQSPPKYGVHFHPVHIIAQAPIQHSF